MTAEDEWAKMTWKKGEISEMQLSSTDSLAMFQK